MNSNRIKAGNIALSLSAIFKKIILPANKRGAIVLLLLLLFVVGTIGVIFNARFKADAPVVTKPVVSTSIAAGLNGGITTLYGFIDSAGGEVKTMNVGFYYSSTCAKFSADGKTCLQLGGIQKQVSKYFYPGIGPFEANTSALIEIPNKVYYYKAFVTNSSGTSYGLIRNFNTGGIKVITDSSSSITNMSATLKAVLSLNGSASSYLPNIKNEGFIYSTDPKLLTNAVSDSTVIQPSYSTNVSILNQCSQYYWSAYTNYQPPLGGPMIKNFGKIKVFKTNGIKPTVSTKASKNANPVNVTLNGNLSNNYCKFYKISRLGFVYGTNLTNMVNVVPGELSSPSNTNGSYSINLDTTKLLPDTNYYYRSYITYLDDSIFKEVFVYDNGYKTFKTSVPPDAPMVQTLDTNNVMGNIEIKLKGKVSTASTNSCNNCFQIKKYGFIYGTNAANLNNQTDEKTMPDDGSGNFSQVFKPKNYSPGTYYYKAYVKYVLLGQNEEKTIFDNSQPKIVVISTGTFPRVKNINAKVIANTVTLNGETNIGIDDIVEIGFRYGTDKNNMTVEEQAEDPDCGSNRCLFDLEITNLSLNTVYYYQSYAKNKFGKSYAVDSNFNPDILSFQAEKTWPVVTTSEGQVNKKNGLQVIFSGSKYDSYSKKQPLTEFGFVYGEDNFANENTLVVGSTASTIVTTPGIPTDDKKIHFMWTAYLKEETQYSFRAYAKDSGGNYYYGNIMSLKTGKDPKASSLVGYWKLDGDLKDYSGNNNNSTTTGVDYYPYGLKGSKTVSFSGNNYIDIGSNKFPKGNEPRTLSVWYRAGSQPNFSCLFSYGRGDMNYIGEAFGMFVEPIANSFDYRLYFSGWRSGEFRSQKSLKAEEWYNFVFTLGGGQLKMYINGKLDSTFPYNANTFLSTSGRIGGWINRLQLVKGTVLDEIKYYNKVLSADEINSYYIANKP